MGQNCGKHCDAPMAHGNKCILKPHAAGAHVTGTPPCESGLTFLYVDQETADMYGACGFAGILTVEQKRKSWENLGWELLGG